MNKTLATEGPVSLDPLPLLQEIFEKVQVNNNFMDPYSIDVSLITDVVDSGVYNEVADWNCVFDTLYDIFNTYKKETEAEIVITESVVSELAQRAHQYLSRLPIEYHFLLPLPKGLLIKRDIVVTDKISVIRLNEEAVEGYRVANPPAKGRGAAYKLLRDALEGHGASLSIPKVDETYLRITCYGHVSSSGMITVYQQDPIYIYKAFFSLSFALGCLERDHTVLPALDEFAQFAFRAFTEDKKYVSSLTRPNDEAKLINSYIFRPDLSAERIEQITTLITPLVTKQRGAQNEKLRNQIVNSLFWYFETKKTTNPNLKTVFFTSVFDSYFQQEDKSRDKARMISIECSSTALGQEQARIQIEELYKARNQVIHGERPLLDYHIEGKSTNRLERARVEVTMVPFFNQFLTAKLNRFIKSVG